MCEATETFVPAESAAPRLGVPVAWLRSQAEQGQIPHLRVGRRIVFNVPAVERALLSRTIAETQSAPEVVNAS